MKAARVALLCLLTALGGCDVTIVGSGVLAATAIALGLKNNEKKEPKITVSPSSVSFPAQPVAESSTSQTITVTNTGNTALTISSITVSGTDATQFSQSNTCSSVPAGATCTISVSFSPDNLGSKSATLTINHNAQPASSTISLTGIGKDIVLSEISNCFFTNVTCWFEVHNPTTVALDLSRYLARSTSAPVTGGSIGILEFPLPSITLKPGAYAIISGNVLNEAQRGTEEILARQGIHVPFWRNTGGAIEITKNNQTMDFVRIGPSSYSPLTQSQWTGDGITSLASTAEAGYGRSIVRPHTQISDVDTNAASDWIAVDWVTPGGRNDIPVGAQDSDNDGIPDSAESLGGTYAGLDLYALGARTNQRDIFIEVDYMTSTDAGVIPQRAALQKVLESFATKNFRVHFDAGTLFSSSVSSSSFNLGQPESSVPFEKCVTFNPSICSQNLSSRRTVYDWKRQFMELRRRPIFHYMLFGSSIEPAGGRGPSGLAEAQGNDSLITLGGWGLTNTPGVSLNRLVNYQAGTIMHELGHNLGLRHGGNEEVNDKPNYWSVMNYLYQLQGLDADAKSITAYERWRFRKGDGMPTECQLRNSPCGSPDDFVISYSDGSSEDLRETGLNEGANIGRGSNPGAFADWSLNGQRDVATFFVIDLNKDGELNTLRDYDDWSNLVLPFARYLSGISRRETIQSTEEQTRFDPLADDRQEVAEETVIAIPDYGSR